MFCPYTGNLNNSVGSEPTFWRAELFDMASQNFSEKASQAEPGFLLSKPSQTELSNFQKSAIFDYF